MGRNRNRSTRRPGRNTLGYKWRYSVDTALRTWPRPSSLPVPVLPRTVVDALVPLHLMAHGQACMCPRMCTELHRIHRACGCMCLCVCVSTDVLHPPFQGKRYLYSTTGLPVAASPPLLVHALPGLRVYRATYTHRYPVTMCPGRLQWCTARA